MTSRTTFEIREITRPNDWRDFFRIKAQIYRSDPASVRPLNFQQRLQLDAERNPFYLHAERAAFVAYRQGKPVGRICAILDRLHQQHYGDRTGFFGFFECLADTQIAQALLDVASRWLGDRNCDAIRGPVNPSMKSDFGVLVSGHEKPPYIMMAHTPPYYAELLEGAGFEVIRTFNAYGLDENTDRTQYADRWQDYEKLSLRIAQRYPQVQMRSGNPRDMDADIRRINELGNRVRSEGWGFVPFTPEELDHAVGQLKRVLVPDLIYLVTVGDRLAGYIMAMPDLNDALRHAYGPWDWVRLPQVAWGLRKTNRLRIFGLGVDPDYRHMGLVGLLIFRLFKDHSEKYRGWELSWVDAANTKSITALQRFIPLQVSKRYHLYQRSIV